MLHLLPSHHRPGFFFSSIERPSFPCRPAISQRIKKETEKTISIQCHQLPLSHTDAQTPAFMALILTHPLLWFVPVISTLLSILLSLSCSSSSPSNSSSTPSSSPEPRHVVSRTGSNKSHPALHSSDPQKGTRSLPPPSFLPKKRLPGLCWVMTERHATLPLGFKAQLGGDSIYQSNPV